MSKKQPRIILGSSSPQRLELLSLLIPREEIEVIPPENAEEKGFEDCSTKEEINNRLAQIVGGKYSDVVMQVGDLDAIVVTADTVIVVEENDGSKKVLGKPPNDETWPNVVREWFHKYYIGKIHYAYTTICVGSGALADRNSHGIACSSEIQFRTDSEDVLDWYINTGEPIGKAGGYGLQGAGSIFVQRISGGPSTVIGLPLKYTADELKRCGYEF